MTANFARLHRIFLIWGIAASLIGGSGPASARSFRAADTQAEDYPTVQALVHMDKIVQERTGGRHRLQIFHSRQLGEEKETIEQTRAGAIDLNRVNVAPLASFVPEANVLVLPFLFRSVDHLHRVLEGAIGAEILNSFAPSGVVGLAFYDSGARSIYNSVRPVRKLDDLKGLRIRIQQSELMSEMFKALGANPIPLPYGQVMTGLSTQLIDGAENNWPSYVMTGHYRAASYYSLTEHTMSPEVLVMSEKAWSGLSPADQQIFREAAWESSRYMREQWRLWEERSKREAQLGGVTVAEDVDRKAFERAMTSLYDRFLTDPKIKSLVDRIRETP
ncbi:MAG TPA: TRAP transporter substrate-binding protein [Beijerinckiaceae bacterium]|jgi:tripartite ATP-independent transporter DctP family solute receptor|nr:transporter substrate-binding protein [Microvirga sp.]HZB37961.1 TRAP transporter substrate-binding protein [Beijerinckiaceae bacterium]